MHSHTSQVSSAGVTWLRWFFLFFFLPTLRGLVQRHLGMVAAGRALVVLDFDWTVIEENSDTWVIDAIGAKHIYSRRVPATGQPAGWPPPAPARPPLPGSNSGPGGRRACRLRAQGLPWTQLMDATLEQAASELGTTRRDIEAALHRIPLQPEILDVRLPALGGRRVPAAAAAQHPATR
jgi:hypothetical protein